MEIEPVDLAGIALDTFEPTPSTPVVSDPAWRGIVIRAATRVAVAGAERAIVPVVGYAMLDVPRTPLPPMALNVLTSAGEHYVGPIVPQDEDPPAPPPPHAGFSAEDLEGVAAAAYFACDLVAVCALPAHVEGPMTVWAELGAARSNDAVVLLERA